MAPKAKFDAKVAAMRAAAHHAWCSLPTDAHVHQHRVAQLMNEPLRECTVKEHSDYEATLAKIEEYKAWQDSEHGAEAKVRTGTCSRDRSRSRSRGRSKACTHSQFEETPRAACPRRFDDHVAVQWGKFLTWDNNEDGVVRRRRCLNPHCPRVWTSSPYRVWMYYSCTATECISYLHSEVTRIRSGLRGLD